jgi:hypothetical protein
LSADVLRGGSMPQTSGDPRIKCLEVAP